MNIGIDIRSLLNPHQTGVGQFTIGALQSLHTYTDHSLWLYQNAAKERALPQSVATLGTAVRTRIPNKLMTLSAPLIHMPRIDTVIERQSRGNMDVLYSPNIQYAPHTRHTPHVMTVHDCSFVHFPAYYTRKQRLWHMMQRVGYQLRHAAGVIVPSQSTKDDVLQTYGIAEERVHVVYPGISDTAAALVCEERRAQVQQTHQLNRPFFFFLGTLEPRKNIDTLLEAYALGKFSEQGIDLIIAGAPGWNNRELLQTIEGMNGVRYIGYVSEAEKTVLYALATVFVYPSLYEGFGFPVLEAMAQGTPVITSNRTSLPEITHGHAHYVHPYRVDELVHALQASIGAQKDDRLVSIARGYTWQRFAEGMDRVFRDVNAYRHGSM